jgi:hypothetical protein
LCGYIEPAIAAAPSDLHRSLAIVGQRQLVGSLPIKTEGPIVAVCGSMVVMLLPVVN